MYYPEEIIEEVRERNDIVEVISSYVKLQKKGGNYVGLCPFHNEKTPSFSVNQNRQMYHCFGCGVSGNVYTFLMEYENYSFPEAVRYLAERAGVALPEQEYSPEAKKEADRRSRMLEANKMAAEYYFRQLGSPGGAVAYQYFHRRGLTDETIRKFGLGYSRKTPDDLYRYLKEKGYDDLLLKEAGLILMDEKRGIYDRFWNRAMFPIMDGNSKVIGFGGRVLGEGQPKYLNSPETKVFDKGRNLYGLNFARSAKRKFFLLCEGYMDVIALHQAGFTNAVASLGTALTGLQANLMKRYTEEVLLTYDSDGAGRKAALRAIPILKEAGLRVRIVNMDPYKDPDEFIRGEGAESYEKRIKEAVSSFSFELSVMEQTYDLEDPEEKTRFFQAVAKKLLIFPEEMERNNYIEAVSRRYGILYEDMRKLVNQYGARYGTGVAITEPQGQRGEPRKKPDNGLKECEKLLLGWISADETLYRRLKDVLSEGDFAGTEFQDIAQLLFEAYREEGKVNPAKLLNRFQEKEEQTLAAMVFTTALPPELTKVEQEKALNEALYKVKLHSLEESSRDTTDMAKLQELVIARKNLQKLHISLTDG